MTREQACAMVAILLAILAWALSMPVLLTVAVVIGFAGQLL